MKYKLITSIFIIIFALNFGSCVQFTSYHEVSDSYSIENLIKSSKYKIVDSDYFRNVVLNSKKDLLIYEFGPLCVPSLKHLTYVDSVSNRESPNAKIMLLTATYDYKTLEKIRNIYHLKDTLHIIDKKYGNFSAGKYQKFNIDLFEADSISLIPIFGILNRDGTPRCIKCSPDILRKFFLEEY